MSEFYINGSEFKNSYSRRIREAISSNSSLTISENIVFTSDVNFTNDGYIIFKGKVKSAFSIVISNSYIDFVNAELNSVELQQKGKLNVVNSEIQEVRQNDSQQETEISTHGCNIGTINFQNGIAKKIIIQNTDIQSINLNNINGDILKVENTDQSRDLKEVQIVNCNYYDIRFEKITVNQEQSEICFNTDYSAISFKDTELNGHCNFAGIANTIINENSKFNRVTFIGDNSPYKIEKFECNEVSLVGNFSSIEIRHSKIEKLLTNDILNCENIIIISSKFSKIVISNPNIKKLHIENQDSKNETTLIDLLKFDNGIVETYCDGFGQKVLINKLKFNNCNLPKDKTIKFYGIELRTLEFNSFLNYGNMLFTDVIINQKDLLYGNQGFNVFNSDLGKSVFMNCDFKQSIVHFSNSKINEIFLAGVDFPDIKNDNYRTLSCIDDYEQKRLCFTQLKKVYENRGDSINSTKFHEAELNAWKFEHPDDDHVNRKVIYSQYKKMYEGRGDTVKAIEYFGKEMDTQRSILSGETGHYWEKLQLWLNKYSNNFGQSWQWAAGWLLGLGIILFMLYCRSLGFTYGTGTPYDKAFFWELLSQFGEFINPIRKGKFLEINGEEVTIKPAARIIDFFARLLFAYLIYQMVQAFRKYSKKTS